MKSDNFEDNNRAAMDADYILAEDDNVIIWYDQDSAGKVVFVNIGNATVNMPEHVFYTLTKLSQVATKNLLNLD
jgi:hypothetical protein